MRNDEFFEFVKACKLLAGLENKREGTITPYPKADIAQAQSK